MPQYVKWHHNILNICDLMNQIHSKRRKMCTSVGIKIYLITCDFKGVQVCACALPPLLLQQGLCMFLVLPPPGVQFSLHGIHILLDIVHDLTQRQGAATHRLDGWAEPLYLPRHQVSLFLPRCFRHQVLDVEVVNRMCEVWGMKTMERSTCKVDKSQKKFWEYAGI